MNFLIIPYILAVDMMVPPGPSEHGATFDFNITVDSTTKLADSTGKSTHYKLTTVMSCSPYPKSLTCHFADPQVIHDQSSKDMSSSSTQVFDGSMLAGISSITGESVDLEFEEQGGVKISSTKEKSQRSLRMIQKIIDLLRVGLKFDGNSRIENINMVDGCPVIAKADFKSGRKVTREPGQVFLKLVCRLDKFDENTEWVLEVSKTKDMRGCKKNRDYFFGSGAENDMIHGTKISSDVTGSYNNMEITDQKFISIGHTEGTVTAGTKKFVIKDTITVSLDLFTVFMPIEWKRFQEKLANRFL